MSIRSTRPILSGCYPDPSICRVDGTFWLVNSSFEYLPGVPVHRSTDLVHWKQVGHAYTRPTALPLPGGAWARRSSCGRARACATRRDRTCTGVGAGGTCCWPRAAPASGTA